LAGKSRLEAFEESYAMRLALLISKFSLESHFQDYVDACGLRVRVATIAHIDLVHDLSIET
jgi:hypothetical protein